MELLNFVRLKEQNVPPSVKNHSTNCSINILQMDCLASDHELSLVKNHSDVQEKWFKLTIKVENDSSHFGSQNNSTALPRIF